MGACGPWVSRLPMGRRAQAPAARRSAASGAVELGDPVVQASMSSAARLSASTPRAMQRSSGW